MNRLQWRGNLQVLGRVDAIMVILSMLLMGAGILFVYGAGQEVYGGRLAEYWLRQVCWVVLGVAAFVVVCCVDYRVLGRWAWIPYLLSVLLLVLVKLYGSSTHQAQSWLQVPLLGVKIQPAEMAKPATILLTAWLASRPVLRTHGALFVLPVLAVTGLPVLLVCLQPDWGTALVFVPAALAIVFVAGMSWKWVVTGVAVIALAAPLMYHRLEPHQKDRLRIFVQPSRDVSDAGWNAHQSLLAVGSGGLWGKGFMNGTQHVLGFLPPAVAPTDFIFSVIAEEAGFVGAGAVVCAFIGIILCCLRTAVLAPDEFGLLLAVGVAAMFFVHVYINIGMTMQAAPIIGIPLPFVSYGGSFMVSTMISAGLLQSVHVRRIAPTS